MLGVSVKEELPPHLRTIMSLGSFALGVYRNADKNARARVAEGQRPDLLEDVLKGAHVHAPKLEELLAQFTGRTTARTMVDLMLNSHGVMGLLNDFTDATMGAGFGGPANDPAGSKPPPDAPPPPPVFRPDLTSAAGPRAADPAQPPTVPTFRADLTSAAASQGDQAHRPQAAPAFRPDLTSASQQHDPGAGHPMRAPDASTGAPSKAPRRSFAAFKKELAQYLVGFEQAVAVEQAELRDKIHCTNNEISALRFELRSTRMDLEGRLARMEREQEQAAMDNEAGYDPGVAQEASCATPEVAPGEVNLAHPEADASVEEPSDDDDEVSEYEAAEIMEMIVGAQQRACASIAQERAAVDSLGSEVKELRIEIARLNASR